MAKKIGTHDGTFHCDEVLACYLLRQHPNFANHEIVRSRSPAVLDECDIVVDVGGVFDHSKQRYDHHQREFRETMKSLWYIKPWNVKLSSAGLIYLHYGNEILQRICEKNDSSMPVDILFDKMYEGFILEIDAIDNGVSICDEEMKYNINSNLSKRVGYLNPWWNKLDVKEDDQFNKAMVLVGEEFMDRLNYYMSCWWPARKFVYQAIENRFFTHSSGCIIQLGENSGGLPWKMHLYDLEKDMLDLNNQMEEDRRDFSRNNVCRNSLLFVLYGDKGTWRVQCISVSEKRPFDNRLSLMEPWRGLRDEELSEVAEIEGCIFVHASGFIGGAKTYESALQMAVKTIDLSL